MPDDEAAERLVAAFRELLPAVTSLVAHHFRRVLLADRRGAHRTGGWGGGDRGQPGRVPFDARGAMGRVTAPAPCTGRGRRGVTPSRSGEEKAVASGACSTASRAGTTC